MVTLTVKGTIRIVFILFPLTYPLPSPGFEIEPYIQNVSMEGAIIMWKSGEACIGTVHYGETPDTPLQVSDPSPVMVHEISLHGLSPSSTCYYRVEDTCGNSSETYSFRSAPRGNEPFSFVLLGDTRTNHYEHGLVVSAIQAVAGSPLLILNTGDLVEDGDNDEEWAKFFEIETPLLRSSPLLPCPGNHDDGDLHLFEAYFSLPIDSGDENYYSFRFGNSAFVAIDANQDITPSSHQYIWFYDTLSTLSADPLVKNIFVFMHFPPYSSGAHGIVDEEEWGPVREYLVPLFEFYGVKGVFSGHDHHYERGLVNGITYIVSGGGGAPLDLTDYLPEYLRPYFDELTGGDRLYGDMLNDLLASYPWVEYILGAFGIEWEGNPWKEAGWLTYHFLLIEVVSGEITFSAYKYDGTLLDTYTTGIADYNEIDDDGDGFSEYEGDCDDTNPSLSPSMEESCDGMDNNCDGMVDEGCDEEPGDEEQPKDEGFIGEDSAGGCSCAGGGAS